MKKPFYGWIIACCGLLTLMISNGMSFTGITVFDKTLLDIYGWNAQDLKLGTSITIMTTGILAPFLGQCAERWGIRKVMLLGILAQSLGYINYAYAQNLWQIYISYFLFGLTLASIGLTIVVMLVSRWFVKARGTALGLAITGTSFGALFISKLNVGLLNFFGLKQSLLVAAALPIIFLLPIVLWVIRAFPQDKNLHPLGAAETTAQRPLANEGLSFSEALKTRDFWLLGIISTLTFFCMIGILSLLMLYLQQAHRLNAQEAQALFMIPSFASLFGKFGFGYLAERIAVHRVLWANLLLMMLGAALLQLQSLGSVYWIGGLAFGLGWGGIYSLLQLMVMNRFGLKESGKILGTITAMDTIGGGLGPIVLAICATHWGWAIPFQITFVLLGICLGLSLLLRPENIHSTK